MDKKNNVEVLITTLNSTDYIKLLRAMNIQSCAMIGNQCNDDRVSIIDYGNEKVKVYSFNERGVGLNRNNLLMRSHEDYCLFGDDDLRYVDNYEGIINKYFQLYRDADVIIFNLIENNGTRYLIKKPFKVNALNFMRFGAARIAIKRRSILLNGILFNTCFGGGTEHSNGEDTLFLADCIRKKLNIYAVPETIAQLTDARESTWFNGYNEKYLMDKGILYYVMSKKFYTLLCFQDAIRHSKSYADKSILNNYRMMKKGIEKIK